MKTLAVIPAFNEETTIAGVLDRVAPEVDTIVVIDDGSCDDTAAVAASHGAVVLRHVINRGLGAALGTGFAFALATGADAAVTLDADGQHDPRDIPRFFQALQDDADVVIGSRLLNPEGMPLQRRIANTLGNLVTFLLFGAWVTDSQSGFRAFNRKALHGIEIRTNRMEVSSEIIAEARRRRLKLVEIPIEAIYTDYSLSKGQGFAVGLKTLAKLVLRRLMRRGN